MDRDELLAIIHTINEDEAEKLSDLRQQYDTEKEECRSRNVESVNALAASLDNTIEVGGVQLMVHSVCPPAPSGVHAPRRGACVSSSAEPAGAVRGRAS
jgi:hypothetical protein